jgi:anti-sigma factor RsiW
MWKEESGKEMKHPNQATLALHAGGDLGAFAHWRTERHLSRCPQCRDEIAAFEQMRSVLPDLAEIPEIPWNRLAAEMKANIRLGLAAGECVRPAETSGHRRITGFRATVACACIAALMAAGITLQKTTPSVPSERGVVAEAIQNGDGIQVREGANTFRLLHPEARSVTYTAGANGSVEARYVDRETGYITVNTLDVD